MRWLAIATVGFLLAFQLPLVDATAQNASPLPSKPTLDLPVGQGRLLRFNDPVESVLIADTTIADLQIVSPSMDNDWQEYDMLPHIHLSVFKPAPPDSAVRLQHGRRS
ncbi:pilus assembly protein N-terminal domain-containing protein [Mesorhizobium sp. PL10]